MSWAENDDPRLWDLSAAHMAASLQVLKGHTGTVTDVGFSSDSRWVATASMDGSVRLWDTTAENPATTPVVLSGDSGPYGLVEFSPDGHWLAAGGTSDNSGESRNTNTSIHLWQLDGSGPPDQAIVLFGHSGQIGAMAFSPDNAWLVTAGGYDYQTPSASDKSVRLWDLNAARSGISGRVLEGNQEAIAGLAFSSDGRWLAAGGVGGATYVWNMARKATGIPLTLAGHTDVVRHLAFSPDSRWLLTASGYGLVGKEPDTTPRLWDLGAPDPSAEAILLSGHRKPIGDVAFSPDGKWLATASYDATVRLWDIRGSAPITNVITLLSHDSGVGTLAFSPDGRWLASAAGGGDLQVDSVDNAVRVWDVEAEDPAANPIILAGHSGPV